MNDVDTLKRQRHHHKGCRPSGRASERTPTTNRVHSIRSKTVGDDRFDELVRNVYKVLLTRGMQGVVIYSPDRKTRQFLKSLVDKSEAQPRRA